MAKLESGWIRIKRRRNRRPGLPIESALLFYPRHATHLARSIGTLLHTYWKLSRILRRIQRDPARLDYVDRAIRPVDAEAPHLLSDTRSTAIADKRRAQAVQAQVADREVSAVHL